MESTDTKDKSDSDAMARIDLEEYIRKLKNTES